MPDTTSNTAALPVLSIRGAWSTIFHGEARHALEEFLPAFVTARRWFGGKARVVRGIEIAEAIPVLSDVYLSLLRVVYAEGDAELYVLPLGYVAGGSAETMRRERPSAVIARLHAGNEVGILYDAVWSPAFCAALLATIREGRQYHGAGGDLVASAAEGLPRWAGDGAENLAPVLLGAEQSNTSVRYGERLILKLYRRLEAGVNPDQEIGRFLTERGRFANTPPLAGALEFHRRAEGEEPITIALLQGFIPNRGDAWRYTLGEVGVYFAAARSTGRASSQALPLPRAPLLQLVAAEIPAQARQFISAYLDSARLLARRTAELHLALAADPTDPAFAPEAFSDEFQDHLYRSMRELTERNMRLLEARYEELPEEGQAAARKVLGLEGQIAARFDTLRRRPIHAQRSRIHGDYHLGQVLYTGDDFMIIDFEGEPARPLSERRLKRSPLQDVAGMLRSFHYAAYAAYFEHQHEGEVQADLETWARFWHLWVSVAYLQTYLEVAKGAAFLPESPDELSLLLDVHLVEKAVYELGYELNNRPAWSRIPLQGILQTLGV